MLTLKVEDKFQYYHIFLPIFQSAVIHYIKCSTYFYTYLQSFYSRSMLSISCQSSCYTLHLHWMSDSSIEHVYRASILDKCPWWEFPPTHWCGYSWVTIVSPCFTYSTTLSLTNVQSAFEIRCETSPSKPRFSCLPLRLNQCVHYLCSESSALAKS